MAENLSRPGPETADIHHAHRTRHIQAGSCQIVAVIYIVDHGAVGTGGILASAPRTLLIPNGTVVQEGIGPAGHNHHFTIVEKLPDIGA